MEETLQRIQNLNRQVTYILAVSGGVDSMVMADMFEKAGHQFVVAHVNYHLRDEASDLDEKLVHDWCTQHQVPCYIHQAPSPGNESIQTWAREIRYTFFESLHAAGKGQLIVTAHQQEDVIETTLFRIFRGSGLKGLQGIPARTEKLIRPLLHSTRAAILAYAQTNNVPFRHDASNDKTTYTRNFIRHEMLPLLESRFPEFGHRMTANITRWQEAYLLYEERVAFYKKKLMQWRGMDVYIPLRKLEQLPARGTLLYECLHPYGFSADQAQEALRLMEQQSGAQMESATHRLIRHRDFLILTQKQSEDSTSIFIQAADTQIRTADFQLTLQEVPKENIHFQADATKEYIDASLLQYPLLLRKWKPGDYLYPMGLNKKKKVARILIDAKMSLPEKEHIWVLESGKKIVWIVGVKPDHRFRITEQTSQVLRLQCLKNT